jgi:hypothetical protein
MKTKKITIEVDADTARAYEETTPEKQRKINAMLSLEIDETMHEDKASLKEIMQEMSREAKANGLTPEILQSILDEEK